MLRPTLLPSGSAGFGWQSFGLLILSLALLGAMIAVWIFLKPGNQIIHQAWERNFHPTPGGVAIGEIVPPLIVGFLGDLALLQGVGHSLPFVQHPVKLRCLLIFTEIDPQANIALGFLHI